MSLRAAREKLRTPSAATHAALAFLAYVPLLVTKTGRVAADTRQYLYTDPGDFLSRSLSLWDPHVHLGTVTHSNLGNVFPMGTFFTMTDLLGIPAWIAQRLWLGSLLFLAGAGMLFLARTLRWKGPGVLIAALAYMLSPYVLQYSSRTSVLLLPFAALPWMLGLTERALRTGGWRHPAALALVALLTAGSNVAALILVAIGPLLWIVFAVARRDVEWRDAGITVLRTAVMTVGTCALWLGSLLVESRHGVDVLAYTETLEQVSTTSTAHEALRGLGYWLFYGNEARAPNVGAAVDLLESTPILLAGYLLAGLALVAAFTVRWRQRTLAIAFVVVGVVVAVGAYPMSDSSLIGRAYRKLADSSSLALALRSSTRVVPVVVLGLALFLGVGINALFQRRRAWGVVGAGVAAVLVLVSIPALFTGEYVDANFSRPSDVPQYWRDAARSLDQEGDDTRVLEIPGSQFAAYRWGITYETPILAALIDRPSAAREQIPYGSPPAADLLAALDRRMQEGTFEPESLAPLARIMSASDIVLRSDLQYERYASPRPRALWAQLSRPVPGLKVKARYGEPRENAPDSRLPLLDAQTLGTDGDAEDPPPVVVYRVDGVRDILHTQSGQGSVLLDGDGDGVVDAAAAGLLSGNELIQYGATVIEDDERLQRALEDGATIVVTDTNRRRERRWRSTRFTTGLTDRAGNRQPETGHGEADLVVFPNATDDQRSVAVQRGATIDASLYGSLVTFDTDQRATAAFDGDPTTAWEIGTTTDPVGERITITSDTPITTDHIDLLQAQGGFRTRVVSEIALTFDGGAPVRRSLAQPATTERVAFSRRTFTTLEIEITGTSETPDVAVLGGSPTGFAEITIPGLQFEELVRLPQNLVRAQGADEQRLVFVMTRLRANPAERTDEEPTLARIFEAPNDRSFAVAGSARLSAAASDDVLEAALGVAESGVRVRASGSLPGALDQRPRAALDRDARTHWTSTFFEQAGAWLEVELSAEQTIDRLDLQVVADGRHSVPTKIRIEAGSEARDVSLPSITDGSAPDAVVDAPVEFEPLTGTTFRVTITEVRTVTSADAFSGRQLPLPIAVAELGVPDVRISTRVLPTTECRDDLLAIDGEPLPVQIFHPGTIATAYRDALAREPLAIQSCGSALELTAGRHELTAAPGRETGIDIDRLVFDSDADGAPGPLSTTGATTNVSNVRVLSSSATSHEVRVPAHDDGMWLVLGESNNDGWRATLDDGTDLGASTLVNGFANGWHLASSDEAHVVTVEWTPQGTVNLALVITILAALVCVALMWRGKPWRPALEPDDDPSIAAIDVRDAPASIRPAVLVVAGAVVATALLVDPVYALGVGALTAGALWWRRGPLLLTIAGLALVAVGFLGVVKLHAEQDRKVGYEWTAGEETEHRLVLTGLVVLAAHPLVTARRNRKAHDTT